MNVLFITEYFPPIIKGGGEINVDLITKALAKKIKIQVLTSKAENLPEVETINNITIHRKLTTNEPSGILNNLKRSLQLKQSIIKEAKKLEYDAIHFIGATIIAAKHLNKPKFATIESFPTLCPKGDRYYKGREECKLVCNYQHFKECQKKATEIGKTKNKFYLKHNPIARRYIFNYYKQLNEGLKHCHLIAISKYVQELLKQQNLNSTVIPNALDIDRYKRDKTNNETIKILYLGSLTKYKGPQVLLEATKNLNCKVDIYGDGVLKEELVKQNNPNVEFHQPIPYNEIPNIYAQADIVVFPSVWPEPFGRIAIEAAAAKIPVIGSDIGAIKETIKNNGILFPANDPNRLRESLNLLIHNKELREQLSAASNAEEYREEVIADKIIELYNENIRPRQS